MSYTIIIYVILYFILTTHVHGRIVQPDNYLLSFHQPLLDSKSTPYSLQNVSYILYTHCQPPLDSSLFLIQLNNTNTIYYDICQLTVGDNQIINTCWFSAKLICVLYTDTY